MSTLTRNFTPKIEDVGQTTMFEEEFHFAIREEDLEEFLLQAQFNVVNETRRHSATFIEYFCCCLYAQLFLFGLISNVVVLRILITVLRHRARASTSSQSSNNSVLIYLISLCLVNVLVLAALPLTIANVATGEWRLPRFLCYVYWIAETMNKIMTSMISASFSVACYFSVCRFNVTQMYKSSLVAALILLSGFSITCWLANAALTFAGVFHIGVEESNETFVIKSRKCLFHPMHVEETTKFTVSTILCGYGLPSLIMLLCYAAILKKVFDQSRMSGRRISSRFRRTAVSVTTLIMFYVCTWTPYWVLIITLNALTDDAPGQKMISKFAVVVHILPFLNSAFSPLVYVLLNRDIRAQYNAIRGGVPVIRKETTTVLFQNGNGSAVPLVKSEHVISDKTAITPCAQSV